MKLKEFQEKHGIKRIDFEKVMPVEYDEQHSSDNLICPYCGSENELEGEYLEKVLNGTPFQCGNCDKWFYAEGEMTIESTCTPMENKVLEPYIKRNIMRSYKYMDECDRLGCEWDRPYGVVEYETYREYARPLFENEKIDSSSAACGQKLTVDIEEAEVKAEEEKVRERREILRCAQNDRNERENKERKATSKVREAPTEANAVSEGKRNERENNERAMLYKKRIEECKNVKQIAAEMRMTESMVKNRLRKYGLTKGTAENLKNV